jgi:hypothetical protein
MPRRLKAKTREKGVLELYAITEAPDGTWETGWEELRGTVLGGLVSRVPRSAFNHLLNGFSAPFTEALGIAPSGALVKLPSERCDKQRGCVLYDRRKCVVGSRKLPWCYEPAGIDGIDAVTRRTASDLVFLWKQEVYVVAVFDD